MKEQRTRQQIILNAVHGGYVISPPINQVRVRCIRQSGHGGHGAGDEWLTQEDRIPDTIFESLSAHLFESCRQLQSRVWHAPPPSTKASDLVLDREPFRPFIPVVTFVQEGTKGPDKGSGQTHIGDAALIASSPNTPTISVK